jgi:rhamnose transport system permease protein
MIHRYQRELSVALAYLLLLLVLAAVAPTFYQSDELRNILVSRAPVLVAAVGMTLVILTRHIDISIGSQLAICGVAAGLLAQARMPMPLAALLGQATVPMPLVVLGTLVIGAGMGATNGVLVAGLRLPSIVVTLATLVIGREALRWVQKGAEVRDLPANFQWFGLGQGVGQWVIVGIALAVFLLFAWGLRNLAAGRAVYATGSDREAARLAGIRPNRVVFSVFLLMGALTGLAALLHAVRFPAVDSKAGTGLELQVIASVVVGGVAVSGGRGTLLGSLVGVLLLGTIGSALVFLGTKPQWEKAIQGVIILVAVASDALERKGK